jgi:hypothetical protein
MEAKIKQPLAEALVEFTSTVTADDLREEILLQFETGWIPKGWTADELLIHPNKAVEFCNSVRNSTSPSIPDHLVLRTLMNLRRAGKLVRRREARQVWRYYLPKDAPPETP